MIHEAVDIDCWKAMFPLAPLRDEARERVLAHWQQYPAAYVTEEAVQNAIARAGPRAEAVTSPFDLAIVEQLREEALASGLNPKRRVPTDVFIFGRGEPDRREVTKVGGLPYWPAGRSWPQVSGRPMTFVAQFCFADSRDIVGNLPGDILLIFVDCDNEDTEEKARLQLEWMKMGEGPLIDAASMPATGTSIVPRYGAIYRTFDYLGHDVPDRCLWQIEGTKIGGTPSWIQGSLWPWRRFLCACGSIQPALKKPYPYLNVPGPLETVDEEEWMWGDAGSLYIFRGPFNTIRWTVQYY